MIHGRKKSLNGTFYLKKPHFCPDCKEKMEVITVKKIVNSGSPEASQYDFTVNYGTSLSGNIEFSRNELKCPCCGRQLSIDEMKKIELDNMEIDQLRGNEKKEKLKVALFKLGLVLAALIFIIFLLNK